MPALISILFGASVSLLGAWGLGALVLRRSKAPVEIALAVGAALESLLIFALLLCGAAHWAAFLGVALFGAAAFFVRREPGLKLDSTVPRWIAAAVFVPYFVYYLVNALAPEITPDGAGYHLGLVSEYVRLGGFPDRVDFYGMLPQGMEMLYTAAFAFGRHSAAKLVHFAFLIATVPLILRTGRLLGLHDSASLAAAALYCTAPVTGISGTSSYNDAAQVFFTLAVFYLLLTGERRWLPWAGLLAGFCYSIKVTGLVVPAAAIAFLLLFRRDVKGAALLAAGAAVAIAPWMIRAAVAAGNPVAPLFNAVFPNPYFHLATERELAANLRTFNGVPWWQVPWQLAVGGMFAGIAGPWLLALPLAALPAPGFRAKRLLWAMAAILALPWFWNTGTRFLMPAMPFAALALAASLPRRALWACVAVEALLCWPAVLSRWEPMYLFRLREFPLRAALRIEPEHEYLWRHNDEYKVARMVEEHTPPGARTLALTSLASSYTTRDARVYWQSAEADDLLDTLRVAGPYRDQPFFDLVAAFGERPLTGLRFRLAAPHPSGEWCIHEILLMRGDDVIHTSPQWNLRGWPDRWELPLALDANVATRWRTWQPMRAGMYAELEFDRPQVLDRAVLLSHSPVFHVPVECYGRGTDARWRPLGIMQPQERPVEDFRLEATRAIKQAGYDYILVPEGPNGTGPMGEELAAEDAHWGVERVARAGLVYLFRIK